MCEQLYLENEDLKRRRAEFLEYSGKAARKEYFFTLHNDDECVRLSKFVSADVVRTNCGDQTSKGTDPDTDCHALEDWIDESVTLQGGTDEKLKGGDRYHHARGKRVQSWMFKAVRMFA